MDAAALGNNILGALNLITDPVSSKLQRDEASKFIESRRVEMGTIALTRQLLEAPEVRSNSSWCYLCLKLFEDCLFYHWNDVSFQDQIEMRRFSCSLCDLLGPNLSEMHIRTKLAKLISDLGKRHYPQLWGSCIQELLSLWTRPVLDFKAQVSAMAIEFMVEDCIDSNFNESMPAKRRNEILQALKNTDLDRILDLAYAALSECYRLLQTVPAGSPQSRELIASMNTILTTLGPISLLAKPSNMTEAHRDYAQVCVFLLPIEALSKKALSLLTAITRQMLPREAFLGLLQQLPPVLTALHARQFPSLSGGMDGHIIHGVAARRKDEALVDNLDYYKNCVETCANFISMHLEWIADRKESSRIDPGLKDHVETFLDALLMATLYISSRRLYFEIAKHWLKLLKSPMFREQSFMNHISSQLMIAYISASSKVPWLSIDEDGPDIAPYNKDEVLLIEIESSEEYISFYSIMRPIANDIVKEISSSFPMVAATFCELYLRFLIEQFGSAPVTSMYTEAFIETESFILYLESVCSTVTASAEESQTVMEKLNVCATCLLSWTPIAPFLILNKLRYLTGVGSVLNSGPELASAAFSYMFQMLTFDIPGADESILDQVLQVRRKAAASISVLCSGLPILQTDTALMDMIFSTSLSFLSQPSVLHAQRTSMLEILVGLANKLPNLSHRRSTMVSIMQPTLAVLSAREASLAFSSTSSLLGYLAECSTDSSKLPLLVSFREAVCCFVGVCRKVDAPVLPVGMWTGEGCAFGFDQLTDSTAFGIMWKEVLPIMAVALSAVIGLWNPTVRGRLESHVEPLSYLYVMPSADITDLTKSRQKAPIVSLDPVTETIISNVRELLLYLLHGVGCAVWHKTLFLHIDCHRKITEAISTHIDFLENRQLRAVLKYVLQRYVLNLPQCGFDIAHPFLMTVFNHIRSRVDIMNPLAIVPSLEEQFLGAEKSSDISRCFQSEHLFQMYIYRKCGISASFRQKGLFGPDLIEEARAAIVIDLLRKIISCLAAIFCVNDILGVQHVIVEKERGADLGGTEFAETELRSNEKLLVIRRACVQSLLLGPGRDALAGLLLDLLLRGLQIPDQVLLAKTVNVFQHLCDGTFDKPVEDRPHGRIDDRLLSFLGNAVFSTCLQSVVRDEKLLNTELVALMESIIGLFEPLASRIRSLEEKSSTFSEHEVGGIPPCVILANFPGCSVQAMLSLCSALSSLKSKKARKDQVKDLLSDIIILHRGEKGALKSGIVNLPFAVGPEGGAQTAASSSYLDHISASGDSGSNAGLTHLFNENK